MANDSKNASKPFRIAARAMRQLGAELITSDEMALYELVKNAFDARSPRVAIKLSAPADANAVALVREQLLEKKIELPSAILQLEKSLLPSLSIEKRAKLVTEFKRFGSDHATLAEFLATFLTNDFSMEIIDTGVGMSEEELNDRFMVVGTPNKLIEKKSKTQPEGLLLGEKGIGRLSMMKLGEHATVRSKKKGELVWHSIAFDWKKFDDPTAFIGDIGFEVKEDMADKAEVHGTEIRITYLLANWSSSRVADFLNKYIRRLQNPFATNELPYPIDLILNGQRQPIPGIQKWLVEASQFQARIKFDPNVLPTDAVALRRELTWKNSTTAEVRTWTLGDISRLAQVPIEICKRLGPFEVRCLWFNRKLLTGGVERTKKDLTNELNVWCGGFAIYRDGFRVGQSGGMDDDWLEWDAKALKTKGFALNRYQTVGNVNITSRGNPYLIDAANRERLVSCSEYDLLKQLLGDIVVTDLRGHIDAIKQLEIRHSIEEESTDESLKRSEDSLRHAIKNVEEISQVLPKSASPQVDEIRHALKGQIEYVETIRNALQLARETRVELLELANIGLVVEIVVHELTRLTQRTGELLSDLNSAGSQESKLLSIVSNLQAQIVATNKRIRSVDVMSPSGRNRKEKYDVAAQVKTVFSGYENRFKRHQIEYEISINESPYSDQRFEVVLVRGLVAQVLENLITNSVYWVQVGVKAGEDKRHIEVEIDTSASSILFSDNGPGIDPADAQDIFKPYYSTRRQGKGLGLYIARELVEYHGGQLYLDATPDSDGRLRTFVLELPREAELA